MGHPDLPDRHVHSASRRLTTVLTYRLATVNPANKPSPKTSHPRKPDIGQRKCYAANHLQEPGRTNEVWQMAIYWMNCPLDREALLELTSRTAQYGPRIRELAAFWCDPSVRRIQYFIAVLEDPQSPCQQSEG